MGKRSVTEFTEIPKVYNPYGIKRSYVLRWEGSVLPKVLPQTFFVTAIAVIVTVLNEKTSIKPAFPTGSAPFVSVLGLVISLLLAYRTTTAYERYSEGLKTWSSMLVAIRNFARCIWVNINIEDRKLDEKKDPKDVVTEGEKVAHIVEKKTVTNLLTCFAIATKYYLRGKKVEFDDLKPIITKENKRQLSIQVGDDNEEIHGTFGKRMLNNVKGLFYDDPYCPVNHNLPYEITLYLSSFVRKHKKLATTDDSTIGILYNSLGTLTDCLTTFERILRSPIPIAYAVHLTQATWLYCAALPFQLVSSIHWATIPIVFLIVITFFGVEKIAFEIENPFGYDANDLKLDEFCDFLNHELDALAAKQIPSVDEWVFTPENMPFKGENISAADALNKELVEVQSYLSNDQSVSQPNDNVNTEGEK